MIDRTHPLPIARQARLLGLARSSVYYRPLASAERDLALMAAIDLVHTELPFYGSRRIRGQLLDRGFVVGRGHVATLMRQMGITAIAAQRRLSGPAPGHKKRWGRCAARAQREVAHLAFHAARVAAAPAGDDALLQDLLQHALMKRHPLPRGE